MHALKFLCLFTVVNIFLYPPHNAEIIITLTIVMTSYCYCLCTIDGTSRSVFPPRDDFEQLCTVMLILLVSFFPTAKQTRPAPLHFCLENNNAFFPAIYDACCFHAFMNL